MKKEIIAEATTENQTTKVTTKKEEKKMAESKKVQKVEVPEFLKAYRQNEDGEFLMTEAMAKEVRDANPEVKMAKVKGQTNLLNVRLDGKIIAKVRFDEDAKKKQIHIHTGATKKVMSGKGTDGKRYKIIYVAKKDVYQMWSADTDGKRKKEAEGTLDEMTKAYEKMVKVEKKAEKKEVKKEAKKSA